MHTRQGFTLIELMIVVAVIAIIAAIAIPSLLNAKISANESSTVGLLKTIVSAQAGFKHATMADTDNDGIGEYGTLAQLTGGNQPWLDNTLAVGTKSGYQFQVTVTGAPVQDEVQWEVSAAPLVWRGTGRRTFYTDESGVIRSSDVGGGLVLRPVGSTFPPI